jgi:two-component system, OmpR family, response regulator
VSPENALRRLACVEDDPHLRLTLQYALGDLGGFSVRTYGQSANALHDPTIYDAQLVLLDVKLPTVGGLEAAKRLHGALGDDIPIVFFAARTNPDDMIRYYRAGAAAVIPKPLDTFALSEELRGIWRRLQKSRALIDDKRRAVLKFCETAQMQAASFPFIAGLSLSEIRTLYPRIFANAHRMGCMARTLRFEEFGALLLRIESLVRAVLDDRAPADVNAQLDVLLSSVRYMAFGLTPQQSEFWPKTEMFDPPRSRHLAPPPMP